MRFAGRYAAVLVLAAMAAIAAPASAPPADPTVRRAADLVEWGRWQEARKLLADAVAEPGNARNAALIAYYAHVLLKFGDLRTGTDQAKRAVALDGACASCHLYMFEAMAERAQGMNQFHALLVLPRMKKQLEKATALDPDSGDVQWAWIDLDLALPVAAGGSTSEALKHADRLSEIDPVDGRLARASIYESLKQSDQALAQYRAAAEDHPDDPRGDFALGQALYKRGDFAAAAPFLAQAFHLNPASALYSAYYAASLVHDKKLPQARTVLDAAQALHPDSRVGDYLCAEALRQTNQDFAWAKQLLAEYLAVPSEPDQPTAAQAQKLLAALG